MYHPPNRQPIQPASHFLHPRVPDAGFMGGTVIPDVPVDMRGEVMVPVIDACNGAV